MESMKYRNDTIKVFLQCCKITFNAWTKLGPKNRYTYILI